VLDNGAYGCARLSVLYTGSAHSDHENRRGLVVESSELDRVAATLVSIRAARVVRGKCTEPASFIVVRSSAGGPTRVLWERGWEHLYPTPSFQNQQRCLGVMYQKACVYFRSGTCRFGDSCRYSHERSSGEAVGPGYNRTRSGGSSEANVRDPEATSAFTLQELQGRLAEKLTSSALSSGNSDALVSFWPDEDRLETLWKGFLTPRDPSAPWLVDSQTQALNFISSGLCALTEDKTTSPFVKELGRTGGRGVAVIQSLLELKYSNDAGRQRDVVSFQRGLVPLVTMLTMRRLELVSLHMDEANYVFSFVRTAHARLFKLYLQHMGELVERHSVEDRAVSHASFLVDTAGRRYAPLCFAQVCLPCIRLLYLLGSKFSDVIYEDSFQEAVNRVAALSTKWTSEPQGGDSPLDSALCYKMMQEEIARLQKMIRRGEESLEVGTTKKGDTQRLSLSSRPMAEPWDVMEVGAPGKGTLPDGSVGPRHDNDRSRISDIQLLPTTAECLSGVAPLVPGNFPFHKNAHWLAPGPERWVDTHFRLYREDLCCTIRACVQDFNYRLTTSHGNLGGGRVRDADVDYNAYRIVDKFMPLKHTYNRVIRDLEKPVEHHGLCFDVRFLQPSVADMTGNYHVVNAAPDTTDKRRELWDKTGRLPFNAMVALVCFSTAGLEVVFCKVIVRDVDRLVRDVAEVTLQPYETRDIATLERWQSTSRDVRHGGNSVTFMMEFNKVLYLVYEPILRALQTIRPASMPFLEYLAPKAPPALGEQRMEPPMFCLARRFSFNLSSVIQSHPREGGDAPKALRLHPFQETSRNECEAALARYSTLERDQVKALIQALCSRVACIQGLPGTGKSLIGSLLTQIIVEAKVSPVLVVCYTNHALDQFLCHLLDAGITSLVRIGGQSKEPRLERYNLSRMRQFTPRYKLKQLNDDLDESADAIAAALRDVSADARDLRWPSVKRYLAANYPNLFDDFQERHAALFAHSWQVAGCRDILDYWTKGRDGGGNRHRASTRSASNVRSSDVWTWGMHERRAALAKWSSEIRLDRVKALARAQKSYSDTLKKIDALKEEADVDVLKRVQIIGMTTSGVAKYQQKIAAVAPRVVICEEAGEVLEAQLMTCLSPACQQLVLIGDHKQLRPQITEYNLSVESPVGKRFALDVSMFERLVGPRSGLPFWILTEQHRMRPEISQLLRMLFYPELRDARETLETPPLLGVDKSVFFVNHSHPEDGEAGSATRNHSNGYEVAYIVATLRYLLQQGYRTDDIAIIMPYLGQLVQLRAALRGQFVLELNELDKEELKRTALGAHDEEAAKDSSALEASKRDLSGSIRVATVDNFQGEEATVVLVSLVRSSTNVHGRGSIGFLKTPNRINVLLSRAKHGLILVGHGEFLCVKSPLWQQVLDQLQSDGCYSDGLPLHCRRHPDDQRIASSPNSFALLAPDGGCLRPCGRRLPRCGHVCPKMCHVDQPSHTAVYCSRPCPRLQEGCGHVCPVVCGDPCGRCNVLVGSIVLPCGHTYKNARCFEVKTPSKLKCSTLVDKTVPRCGHVQRIACSTKKLKCTRTCGAVLPCGHACSRQCSECTERTLRVRQGGSEPDLPIKATEHGECRKECERLLPCCHRCRGVCHRASPCPPCTRICDVFSCEHGSCDHPCSDPCAACTERCNWSCEHSGDCPLPCGAPCNRSLCDRRCANLLSCGHQCPSVCGEQCPSQEFCHECGREDVKARVADVILFQTYGEIDPSEDPVLVLPCCSMVYTMVTLDGTLQMSQYYDATGKPRGALPENYIDTPQCPNCKKPIRGLRRYGRVTKRAAIDAAEKKFSMYAQTRLVALQERVHAATQRGKLTRDKTLQDDLRGFGSMVKMPPCKKVFEACVASLTKARGGEGGGVEIDHSTLPVPNSNFRFSGYFNLFSAQLHLLCGSAATTQAEVCTKVAVKLFADGSYSEQASEARLVLVQVLLLRADEALSKSVKTEEDRERREKTVERITAEAEAMMDVLSASSATFTRDHAEEMAALTKRMMQTVQRA
jgi:hypothetical protein